MCYVMLGFVAIYSVWSIYQTRKDVTLLKQKLEELIDNSGKLEKLNTLCIPSELRKMIDDIQALKDDVDKISRRIKICQINYKNKRTNS